MWRIWAEILLFIILFSFALIFRTCPGIVHKAIAVTSAVGSQTACACACVFAGFVSCSFPLFHCISGEMLRGSMIPFMSSTSRLPAGSWQSVLKPQNSARTCDPSWKKKKKENTVCHTYSFLSLKRIILRGTFYWVIICSHTGALPDLLPKQSLQIINAVHYHCYCQS